MTLDDKQASVPSVEMEEDAEYKRQLDIFVRSSTEKGIELVKIGEIIAGLAHRTSFLDIGAANGELTIPLSQSFKETTVVEPNEKQVAFLRRRCPHFTIYNDLWKKINLGSRCYDFILCSHVLYYIEEGKWLATIEKMYQHLEKHGSIAVVLQSPLGEVAGFFNQFARYDVNILQLWQQLIKRYGEDAIGVRYFINEIWTENLDDMVAIGLFLLLDRKFKNHKDKIGEYFENHHKVVGGYRLLQDEILLTIKKLN